MGKITFSTLAILVLIACTGQPEGTVEENQTKKESKMAEQKEGTVMQIVRLKTDLTEQELLDKARKRAPEFEALPGLVQKYYVKMGEGEYGGIYIWDSPASIAEFKRSQLAASIAEAYRATEPPSVEIVDILFQLRE